MNDVAAFCRTHGLRLKKDLGQNFLKDEEVLAKIVEAADIQNDDHIVEIGPGIGVLTKELLQKAHKVTAIELDSTLIPFLKAFVMQDNTSSAFRKLVVINDNALHVDFPKEPYKIVANIPYHITSPLLRHAFLESEVIPTSLTLLMQKEVAEKICDTKDAGLLTILVKLFGMPHIVCSVPPKAFLPPPKVDSAVLHIESFEKPVADAEVVDEVFKLVKIAFSQKRKMLRSTLGTFFGSVEPLEALDVDPKRRPQTLSVDEWIRLATKCREDGAHAS